MRSTAIKAVLAAATALGVTCAGALAGPLMDRIESGETVRIGFANEVPWAYPGEGNTPLGFVNAYVLGVLGEMGYDSVEPVVTEWGGLIPGLMANRFDIVTGGMYILKERCDNISFSDPMGTFGDAFIVAPGNPKALNTFSCALESPLNTPHFCVETGRHARRIRKAILQGFKLCFDRA